MSANKIKIWIVIGVMCGVVVWQVAEVKARPQRTSEFVHEVQSGRVSRVTIANRTEVKGAYKDNSPELHTLIPANYVEIYKILQDHDVNVEIKEASGAGWVSVLINASPFILLLAFWAYMMRQMRNVKWPPGSSG